MKKLKSLNYIVVALFLLGYTVFDDIVPTFVDNAVAGLEAVLMVIKAVEGVKEAKSSKEKDQSI